MKKPAAMKRSEAGGRPKFHVLNGDATLALLRKAAVPGEFMVWPDMLMEGPLRRRKDGSLDRGARAAFLAAHYGVARKAAADRIRGFGEALASAARSNGEVTLWFEEDFFCQIHLVYLLATLPPALRKRGRVSIICPAKPLGLMGPEALERLFAARKPLVPARAALSRKVWRALSVPAGSAGGSRAAKEKAGLAKVAGLAAQAEGFSSWPLLRRGLGAYAEARSGGMEKVLLQALAKASGGKGMAFPELFRKVAGHPRIRPLGLGDAQVARHALRLASKPGAKIRIAGPEDKALRGGRNGFHAWRLHISPR